MTSALHSRVAKPPKGHATSGYTLIELLVTLAIASLLSAIAVSGLSTSARSIARMEADSSELDGVVLAQQNLRHRLEALRAIVRLDSSTPTVDAQGDEASFTFIAPPLSRAQPDALWRYRLIAVPGGDLTLYHVNTLDRSLDVNKPGVAGWQPIKLLENVGSLRINYFGPDPVSRERRWQTRWFRRPQPPDLVRISLQFGEGDRRLWPDLVVRPRSTINAVCKIDALTGRCDFES